MTITGDRVLRPATWALSLVVSLVLIVCIAMAAMAAEDEAAPAGPTGDAEWIHEDIEAGYARARETGKPLLVAFR